MNTRPYWLALLLVGCPKTKQQVDQSEVAPSTEAQMESHYVHATAIRNGVIWGDLSAAQDGARLMLGRAQYEQPEGWDGFFSRVEGQATEVMTADSLESAAMATARIAAACGECHARHKGGPDFDFDRAPPEEKDVVARMARHQWGAERMWEGLILEDATLYEVGARSASGAPLWEAEPLPDDVAALETRVRDLAAQGEEAADDEGRIVAYGQLLGTCGSCHEIAR